MPTTHHVSASEIGMIRIYLKPSDRAAKGSIRTLWASKPLYRALVAQAKTEGIMNAVAHHTHFGYSNHSPVREHGTEISDPHLTMCVELIDHQDALEQFCAVHGDLLANKVIVYKHFEHWSIGPAGIDHEDATSAELTAEPDTTI